MTYFAAVERNRLCDLAMEAGGTPPTLCGDWTVKDLVVHLMVREKTAAAPGIVVPALSGLVERATARFEKRTLEDLVKELRDPRMTWAAVPILDRLLNTAEYFVHHEDIRRGQPGWAPRTLLPDENKTLWRVAGIMGRGLVRPAGVPVRIRNAVTGAEKTLRRGDGAVVITGDPSELLLMLFGRGEVTGLEFSGPPDTVDRFRSASLGV